MDGRLAAAELVTHEEAPAQPLPAGDDVCTPRHAAGKCGGSGGRRRQDLAVGPRPLVRMRRRPPPARTASSSPAPCGRNAGTARRPAALASPLGAGRCGGRRCLGRRAGPRGEGARSRQRSTGVGAGPLPESTPSAATPADPVPPIRGGTGDGVVCDSPGTGWGRGGTSWDGVEVFAVRTDASNRPGAACPQGFRDIPADDEFVQGAADVVGLSLDVFLALCAADPVPLVFEPAGHLFHQVRRLATRRPSAAGSGCLNFH